jgi:hypothetical protein
METTLTKLKYIILTLGAVCCIPMTAPAELTVGKTCRVLDPVALREAPGESAKKLVNQKMLRWDPDTVYYYSVDKSTTVRIEEIKDDWVRVQLVSPPELISTHRGWVHSGYIEGGASAPKKKKPTPISAFTPFRTPEECIRIPLELGFQPAEGLSSGWTSFAGVWGNYTTIITHRGRLSRVGDVDNEITCDIESKFEDSVEYITIRANCFNSSGEQATLEKFRSVVTGMLKELGISEALSELSSIPPSSNKKIDGDTYTIEFKRENDFQFGYGWIFLLTTK